MSDAESLSLKRLGRLLRYARPYRRSWVFFALLSLAASGLALAQPWPLQVLVDRVLADSPAPIGSHSLLRFVPGADSRWVLLALVAVGGLGIFLLNSLLDTILTYIYVRAGQRMVYDVAADLFAKVQRRSLAYHSQASVGDAMSRITYDCWAAYGVVDGLLLSPGRMAITLIALLAIMLSMNWPLALLCLVAAPFMAASALLLGNKVQSAARVGREIQSSIQSLVQQTLAGIQVVTAFGQEDHQLTRFHTFAAQAIKAQQRSLLLTNLAKLGIGLAATMGTGLILLVGARQVLAGKLTLGSLLVFLAYLAAIQAQMQGLATTYTGLRALRAQVERVLELLDQPSDVPESPAALHVAAVRGRIELEGVEFGYDPGRPVLRDVSVVIDPGQTVAIVGPTGAGKSTLVGLIPRFFDPWQGRVLVDGRDLRQLKLKELRGQISLVLQEPFLFPLTIAQNIAYGKPSASVEQIESAARAANAHEFIEKLPEGYQTIIGERGATLSGGQRQRLSIARALLKDAPILILDEPTSALDAGTESLLLEALARLMKGRTTLIIAHRLSTIRNADTILVLEDGRIVERGSHPQLLSAGGKYAALYNSQFATRPADAEVGA